MFLHIKCKLYTVHKILNLSSWQPLVSIYSPWNPLKSWRFTDALWALLGFTQHSFPAYSAIQALWDGAIKLPLNRKSISVNIWWDLYIFMHLCNALPCCACIKLWLLWLTSDAEQSRHTMQISKLSIIYTKCKFASFRPSGFDFHSMIM